MNERKNEWKNLRRKDFSTSLVYQVLVFLDSFYVKLLINKKEI